MNTNPFYFPCVSVAKSLLIVLGTLPKAAPDGCLTNGTHAIPVLGTGPSVRPPTKPMAVNSIYPVRALSTYSKLFDQTMANRQVKPGSVFRRWYQLLLWLTSFACAPLRCSSPALRCGARPYEMIQKNYFHQSCFCIYSI